MAQFLKKRIKFERFYGVHLEWQKKQNKQHTIPNPILWVKHKYFYPSKLVHKFLKQINEI